MSFTPKRTAALLAVVAAFAIVATAVPAGAVSTPFKTITAGGGSCGVNVGLAFDGKNLIVSCDSDGRIDVVNSATGALVSTHKPAGISGPGAMAWDEAHKKLWICNSNSDVGSINTTTWTYTKAFTSAGCFDGLAYDGSDNTLWTSPDANPNISHYTATGTLLGTKNIGSGLGGSGNSGIAVGGKLLYLANDGGSQIWTSPKDFSVAPTLFATLTTRLEDMECDNVTFSAQNKTVMWVIDAYDRTVSAFTIPNGSCSFGGGAIVAKSNGCAVTVDAGTSTGTVNLVSFTGPQDSTYKAVIDWGDGKSSNGSIVAKGGGNFVVQGSHTYAAAGSFTVKVTVSDAKNATNTSSATCASTVSAKVASQGSTTTSTTPPTTAAPVQAAELPRTGSTSGPLSALAVGLLLAGGAALVFSRRRRVA